MNVVFIIILLSSLVVLTFTAPETALASLISGSEKGLDFAIKLFSVYAIWLSVLHLWRMMHFDSFLAKRSKSILKKIFPKEDDGCYNELAVNLTSNLIGMGSAGTPAGMAAMEKMKEKQNRAMLLVVNSTSVQIIPSTVIALRSTQGATTDIILPTFLATIVTTFIGFVLVKVFVK